jgi:hypothetical protein
LCGAFPLSSTSAAYAEVERANEYSTANSLAPLSHQVGNQGRGGSGVPTQGAPDSVITRRIVLISTREERGVERSMDSSDSTSPRHAAPGYPAQHRSEAEGFPPPGGGGAAAPAATSSSGATSALAVAIGLLGVALLGFFACSVVAIGKRWSRGSEQATSFQQVVAAASPPQTQLAGSPVGRIATVVLPPGRPNGVLRAGPAMNAAVLAYLPAGTTVEVGTSRTVPGRTSPDTWFQTRATVRGATVDGWMHKDILHVE